MIALVVVAVLAGAGAAKKPALVCTGADAVPASDPKAVLDRVQLDQMLAKMPSDPWYAWAFAREGKPRCAIRVTGDLRNENEGGFELTFTFPSGATYVTGNGAAESAQARLKSSGLTDAIATDLAKKYAATQGGLKIDFSKPDSSVPGRMAWWDPNCNCHVAVLRDKDQVIGVEFGMAL